MERCGKKIGLGTCALSRRLLGRIEFRLPEIQKFQKCYNLTNDEIMEIFFEEGGVNENVG